MLQYIPYIFYALLAIGAVAILISRRKIRKHGIETDAIVTRVEKHTSKDDEGFDTTIRVWYVTFTGPNGREIETSLMDPYIKDLKIGDRVRVKYNEKNPKRATMVKTDDAFSLK